ncbi:hypothetical protein Bca4012_029053 [Brassica carinata]|uniref:Calmodulin-binding domain-containing protein n=3 Tax=Brassica TaxID=3705 RepID=A0ABQ7ZQN8_BRANA|nr:PREDICTED: uncharacterized protein LOC106336853 [Brassica oleracea var. oleracea]XP_013707424.1 calmodulin binding protein PICBP-like [Brassica napus]KAG2289887.1 hypothetical protein Bca52824_049491 [Brassica carinata]KAH0882575.1 hypothetical protein HID58_058671 [Brassica napus]
MVQRKTCQATESYNNLQPETRFGQEHVKSLGPEMMMMKKRTKPKRKVIDSPVSQSGKLQSTPKKHDLVVKGTGMSPNYMKGTSSSEARKENKSRLNQKNQTTGLKHDSRHGVIKEKNIKKPSSRMVRGLTKAPSFKRCSQRATCSSTLKDSKFPDYLMLHDDEAVSGTSVLKVCPYTYCSLNGHLHKQYPPLKSFISSRRRSLKSQKKASKENVVEMYVEEKKEYEVDVDVGTQISEALSEGAPYSETDSDGYFGMEETFVADSVKEIQETHEADDHYSGSADEMVKTSEGEHGTESRQSDFEESLVDDTVKETSCEVNDDSDSEDMVRFLEGDDDLEETLLDDSVKDIQENSEADEAGEETLNDNKAEDHKEELQGQTEETKKAPYNRKQKPSNQEESDVTMSWTIMKGKKPLAETEDLKEFNPREPNYLPLVEDADTEKVDLKHKDIDERRNSEDWMFDYALQRAVTKLSSARKRKVALLVEAFETVKPVVPHGREPAPVMSYGRHLQTCN